MAAGNFLEHSFGAVYRKGVAIHAYPICVLCLAPFDLESLASQAGQFQVTVCSLALCPFSTRSPEAPVPLNRSLTDYQCSTEGQTSLRNQRSEPIFGKGRSPCRKRSPAKGVWQKSDEKSDKSVRKSDRKVTESVPKTKKSDRNSFCRTPFAAP